MEKYVINILTIFYSYFFSPSYVNAHNFFFFFFEVKNRRCDVKWCVKIDKSKFLMCQNKFFFFFRTRVLTSQANQLQKQRNGKTSKISRDPLTYFGPKHKPM